MKNFIYSIICCICYSFYFLSCNANQESAQNKDTLVSSPTKDTIQIKRGKDWGFRISNAYPNIIDSLQLQDLYDSTKWWLYLLYCDAHPMIDDLKEMKSVYLNVTFSELELRFDTVKINKDTIDLYFWFYINDHIAFNTKNYPISEEYINGRRYYDSINSNRDILCCLSYASEIPISCFTVHPVFYNDTTIVGRRVNPLQPKVVQYINEHKDELHPWFYREAIKRGVLKE